MDILIALALVITVWMIVDCLRRKERPYWFVIWIIIMVIFFPLGTVAYWIVVKKLNQTVSKMERSGRREATFETKEEPQANQNSQELVPKKENSTEDKLRQLNELKEKNLINDEEYNQKKEKLLEEL